MKRNLIVLVGFILINGIFSFSVFGQNAIATASEIKFTDELSRFYGGKLYVHVNGKNRKIFDHALDVWIVNDGKEVVFSGRDGSGGFENEGQSLRIYDVKTGKIRKILSEYFIMGGLTEVKLTNGQNALLVDMGDGALGGSYFAVVDPKRGEVLFRHWAEISAIKGDSITVSSYDGNDWELINDKREWRDEPGRSAIPVQTDVKPKKTETFDLKEVFKNKVIYNKTGAEIEKEYLRKYRDITIYQWRPNDPLPDKDYFLMAVGKAISAKDAFAPLRPTLALLFAPASQEDKNSGFESAVFGMKFEGVVLSGGSAIIKFSQPTKKTKLPASAPRIFLEAVEKTAKQFPTVKKVIVCEVGGGGFAFESEPQIPKCSK